jgi:hypothetical protein
LDQKVKQHRFLKYLWLLNTPKKCIQSHLLRPGSGSGPRRSDPDPTKKVRIRPDPDPQHWLRGTLLVERPVNVETAANLYYSGALHEG